MEQTRKSSKGLFWLLFLASSALLAYGIFAHWEYLTLILPFQVTFFAKAIDIMWFGLRFKVLSYSIQKLLMNSYNLLLVAAERELRELHWFTRISLSEKAI